MSLQYYDSDNEALIPIAGNVNPSDVIELKATKADKTQISNPNLLDNPWFTINQRGQATYTGNDGFKYTVDRWAFVGSSLSSVSVINNDRGGVNVTIDSSSADNAFVQVFDKNGAEIENKTITVSIILNDIMYSESITVHAIPQTGWDVRTILEPISGFLVELARNANGTTQIVIRPPKNGNTYSIKAVKVEIGNTSTLAMDTIPNYALELLKCQRYFLRVPNTGLEYPSIGNGSAFSTTEVEILIPTPIEMRTLPSVLSSGNYFVRGGGISVGVAIGQVFQYGTHGLTLVVYGTGIANNYCYELVVSNDVNAYIDFSADL